MEPQERAAGEWLSRTGEAEVRQRADDAEHLRRVDHLDLAVVVRPQQLQHRPLRHDDLLPLRLRGAKMLSVRSRSAARRGRRSE